MGSSTGDAGLYCLSALLPSLLREIAAGWPLVERQRLFAFVDRLEHENQVAATEAESADGRT